jgi:hypothetical protein
VWENSCQSKRVNIGPNHFALLSQEQATSNTLWTAPWRTMDLSLASIEICECVHVYDWLIDWLMGWHRLISLVLAHKQRRMCVWKDSEGDVLPPGEFFSQNSQWPGPDSNRVERDAWRSLPSGWSFLSTAQSAVLMAVPAAPLTPPPHLGREFKSFSRHWCSDVRFFHLVLLWDVYESCHVYGYQIGTDSSCGSKAAETWNWLFVVMYCPD